MIWLFFILFAALALFSAIRTITHKNPVYSALFLIVTFFAIAGCYYLLQAPFLSIVQIIVYAGAIMVLFLFVIMLLDLKEEIRLPLHRPYQIGFALLLSCILLAQAALFITSAMPKFSPAAWSSNAPALGRVETVGLHLYTRFLYPFEIASVLLLVGIVGAIILGRKKLPKEF